MQNDFFLPTVPRGQPFELTITIDNPEEWNKWSNCTELFLKYWEDYFKEIVFECHRYLIRVTPISTGRLRGGWTALLNKYSKDYTAQLIDTSLIEIVRDYKPDPSAIMEGMALSQYVDEPFLKTIINGVPYGEYVEWGTSRIDPQFFTHKTIFKSELIFRNAIEKWAKVMSEQGIVEAPPVEAVVA